MAALTIVLLVLGGVFAGVFVMAFIAGGEVAQLEQENTDLALELAAMKQQRLIAMDGHVAAWCWVPAWDLMQVDDWPSTAGVDTKAKSFRAVPLLSATVGDHEHRVRDLMKFLLRLTGPKDSLDMPVQIDLDALLSPADDAPALLPEWERPAVTFELPTFERVTALRVEGDWVTWRAIAGQFTEITGVPGQGYTPENLDKLVKIARTVSGGGVQFDFRPGGAAWSMASSCLAHPPAGIITRLRTDDDDPGSAGAVVIASDGASASPSGAPSAGPGPDLTGSGPSAAAGSPSADMVPHTPDPAQQNPDELGARRARRSRKAGGS